jgi:hypothetical protein
MADVISGVADFFSGFISHASKKSGFIENLDNEMKQKLSGMLHTNTVPVTEEMKKIAADTLASATAQSAAQQTRSLAQFSANPHSAKLQQLSANLNKNSIPVTEVKNITAVTVASATHSGSLAQLSASAKSVAKHSGSLAQLSATTNTTKSISNSGSLTQFIKSGSAKQVPATLQNSSGISSIPNPIRTVGAPINNHTPSLSASLANIASQDPKIQLALGTAAALWLLRPKQDNILRNIDIYIPANQENLYKIGIVVQNKHEITVFLKVAPGQQPCIVENPKMNQTINSAASINKTAEETRDPNTNKKNLIICNAYIDDPIPSTTANLSSNVQTILLSDEVQLRIIHQQKTQGGRSAALPKSKLEQSAEKGEWNKVRVTKIDVTNLFPKKLPKGSQTVERIISLENSETGEGKGDYVRIAKM